VKKDRDFRTLLISWMMMGVGNLIAACLFVEYLANPRHGINLPERDVAWITGRGAGGSFECCARIHGG
jgi:hypothetical protein